MPAERVAMRQAREIARLKYLAGVPTRAIARRLGVAASTVRETLRRFEGAGLGWPLPNGMSDGDLEAATTARYAHLDNDPLRRASEAIASSIAAALEGTRRAIVLPLRGRGH